MHRSVSASQACLQIAFLGVSCDNCLVLMLDRGMRATTKSAAAGQYRRQSDRGLQIGRVSRSYAEANGLATP